MFRKKIPLQTNYSSIFSAKVHNLAVVSFIYMIRIRFFGPGELIQKGFSGAQYERHACGTRLQCSPLVATLHWLAGYPSGVVTMFCQMFETVVLGAAVRSAVLSGQGHR